MDGRAGGGNDLQREHVGDLSATKQALLDRWLSGTTSQHRSQDIKPRGAQVVVPVSAEQEHVWLHAGLAPDVPLYNEAITIHRRGGCDPGLLAAALNEVIRRHEIWRTEFRYRDNQLVQHVHPQLVLDLPFTDLTILPQAEREPAALRIATDEARRAFDLSRAPLLRGRIIKIGEAEYRLHLALHHIIFDGVSLYNVLLPTLAAIYERLEAGQCVEAAGPAIPELQYGDYAAWRAQQLGCGSAEPALSYWRDAFASGLPVVQLPADRPPSAEPSHRGEMESFSLPASVISRVRDGSRALDVTPYALLLASFKALLFRYTGQTDMVVGGVADMRRDRALEALIGYFLNTLPIRTRPDATMPFSDYARHTGRAVLEMLDARDVPISHLIRALQPRRDTGMHPLFSVLFSIQPPAPPPPDGWDLTQMDVSVGAAKFDLYLELEERPDGLAGRFLYSTDRFDAATIRRMIGHWTTILEAALDTPALPLGELPLLTAAEQADMARWNDTSQDLPAACLHELLEAQARRTPAAMAVLAGDGGLTYGALDARAERIAAGLRRAGAGPGALVAIGLDRSTDLVAALFGVLKAGAAYVPLDAAQPAPRLEACLNAVQPDFVIVHPALDAVIPQSAARRLCLDTLVTTDAALPTEARLDPASLAYVLCTSGTTGRPKAVEIPHRAVVNLLLSMHALLHFGPEDSLLAITTLGFDIAALELFLPLLSGGRTIIADRETAADPSRLAAQIESARPTVMQGTPSTWRGLLDAGWGGLAGLRVLVGGEALPRPLADALLSRAKSVWNVYGPTETTIWSTAQPVRPGSGVVPIGQPIANTTASVVDHGGHALPVGVPGELCIGGAGLARGYRGQRELTSQRFVTLPAAPGERVYRTGDVVRRRADGALEWIGRNDDQLKIRGHRVEPGEVEAVLASLPGVRNAAVVAHADADGAQQLAAYIAGRDLDPSVLRREAARRLPSYMVPGPIWLCDQLPLTAHGKIDRQCLTGTGVPAAPATRPMTETERRLADIWNAVLGCEAVDPGADFFALGGHSLLAVRLLALVEAEFGLRVTPSRLFQSPTIEALAALLEEGSRADLAEPVKIGRPTPCIAVWSPELRLRRVRAARGPARGIVLGMPGLRGHAAGFGTIAANALPAYDLWTFEADTGGISLTEQDRWVACASVIADRLLADASLQPSAFLGYSMAGTISWMVDHFLIEAGRAPTPVLNFDGGMKRVLQTDGALPPGRDLIKLPLSQDRSLMLLLHRGSAGRFAPATRSEGQWHGVGVRPALLTCRTLAHDDLIKPAAISASAASLASFIAGGAGDAAGGMDTFDFDTLGGALFRWLETPRRLGIGHVQSLITQERTVEVPSIQQALLLVATATGNFEFALGYAQRLRARRPDLRAATYAGVSLLAALGRRDEAAHLAADWNRARPRQPMRVPARDEETGTGRLVLGSDKAMDWARQAGSSLPADDA